MLGGCPTAGANVGLTSDEERSEIGAQLVTVDVECYMHGNLKQILLFLDLRIYKYTYP